MDWGKTGFLGLEIFERLVGVYECSVRTRLALDFYFLSVV
jgi:hypothetical protein